MARKSTKKGKSAPKAPDEQVPAALVVRVHRVDEGGRPTDYKPAFCQRAAELAENGATDFEIAQALECHPRTLYRWMAEHPEFRQSIKLGKECADERVERSLYHRANGYSFPAVKVMQDKGLPVVVAYTEHVPPDPTSISLWLRNRRPDDWKDNRGITGANGGNVIIECISRLVRPGEPVPEAA